MAYIRALAVSILVLRGLTVVNQSTNTGKHGWDGHGIGHIIGHVIGHVIRAFAPRAAGEWPIYATVCGSS